LSPTTSTAASTAVRPLARPHVAKPHIATPHVATSYSAHLPAVSLLGRLLGRLPGRLVAPLPGQLVGLLVGLLLGLFLMLASGHATAHEGHDHGDDPQPVVGTVAPRFEARSDLFEVVGVLQGDDIVLYLDNATNNAPLLEGEIEIESAGLQGKAQADAHGVFRFKAGGLAKPGNHALTLTITANDEVDLLSANFEHSMQAADASTEHHDHSHSHAIWWAGAALLIAVVLGWLLRTFVLKPRQQSTRSNRSDA
jgi:F0F1-type ATP synthase assembly protein I